jgi:glycosyltransferase involved in cell wall biosynthesis
MISGAAMFVRHLAEAMSARGHQVLVLAASDKPQPYTQVEENLSVLRLPSFYNPMRVGQRLLLYPRWSVLKALREFQPDVIHSHDPFQLGALGREYARQAHIPITLTTHQLPWFVVKYLPEIFGLRGFIEGALWMYARWLLPQFTSVISPTPTISTVIKNRANIQTRTISYGMDLESFHPQLDRAAGLTTRAKLNLPDDAPIILHVGRLDADKSVGRVVSASANILREGNVYLVIVGDGCQKPALMKMCQSLGIAERVRFTGYVSMPEGLPKIYQAANLFVTASEIETQGIVLLEAAASGLPIVAVRATCVPEIVHDGVNGYLAEPGDIRGLENSIRALLSDPLKAKEMGMASRALIASHAAQYTIDRHIRLYQRLIVKKTKSPVRVFAVRYKRLIRGWLKL